MGILKATTGSYLVVAFMVLRVAKAVSI